MRLSVADWAEKRAGSNFGTLKWSRETATYLAPYWSANLLITSTDISAPSTAGLGWGSLVTPSGGFRSFTFPPARFMQL